MESMIEDKAESLEKPDNDADNTKVDSSQSDAFVSRVKLEDLRSTKSSPHRNLELHHTRSFSEIYHLHPSCTDISCMSPICPKPKAISDLQHEVRRPESVLQLSDLGAFSDSDDASEEDVMRTQQKGDEAMKIFLESNISIPLDGAMTSSSLSEDTLDSDIASESELIVGNWERGGRDLIASACSSIEKRFLTPSGQLLYREHQVDSMLDTKRLKLTPSSSERPISPLAMRKNDENVKYKTSSGGSESATSGNEKGRRYKMESDSDSEDQENYMNREIPVDNTDGEKVQNTDCDCGLRLQNLKQVVHKYEVQCEELIDRSKEQYDEIKTLRKDNANMHREHNRLQLVRECYQNEDALKENMAAMSKEKEEKVEKLKKTVQELENNLQQKALEIVTLQNTIDSHVEERAKYVKTIKEINTESKALLEALAKELGLDKTIEIDNEENAEAVVILLKTRRHSLPDYFKNFPKKLNQATESGVVNKIENHMKEDFREISASYKDTITKIQKAEKGVGKILKRSASLEGFLKQRKGINNSDGPSTLQFRKTELEGKLRELKRKNDSLMHENKVLQEECTKWKMRCDQIFKQSQKNAPENATVKLRKDKTTASEELKKLKRYLKERRKSYSETQLETLQNNFARPGLSCKAETSSSIEKTANVKGFSDLEDRLKHLSQLTEDLSEKIERSNQHLGNKRASSESKKKQDASSNSGTKDCLDRMLFAFYGGKLFSVVKGLYNDHMSTLQDKIHSREEGFRHLQEQLTVKESNEEVTRCYIASLKRAIAIGQDELRNCKNKNRDLKKELRELKDQVLVTNAEREMALFYCKKNGVVNGALIKHDDSDTQGNIEDVYGMCMLRLFLPGV